ncbi:hypothetical protein CKAH01_17476 [Colletotrichum kahawae]|uniref:Uncharacterized protein n=1 Tax=Colletotrichum kahawae TaxID=34407 RepID=A0AAE0D6F4_COLKA|nr:hypothetical protein CKAH01_17476 [Colletotrichum kahawae]
MRAEVEAPLVQCVRNEMDQHVLVGEMDRNLEMNGCVQSAASAGWLAVPLGENVDVWVACVVVCGKANGRVDLQRALISRPLTGHIRKQIRTDASSLVSQPLRLHAPENRLLFTRLRLRLREENDKQPLVHPPSVLARTPQPREIQFSEAEIQCSHYGVQQQQFAVFDVEAAA